jgi:hypothetical protein
LLILGLDLDPNPEMYPDLHSSKSLDPDPQIMYVDRKHWLHITKSLNLQNIGFGSPYLNFSNGLSGEKTSTVNLVEKTRI